LPRAPHNSFAVPEVLWIQKFLQKSTDSAGLLIFRRRPIVSLKKVALNFPPLEQGPARQEAAGTCFSPPAHELRRHPRILRALFICLHPNTQNFSGRQIVKINSLHDLYVDQLRDLYDAENQLVKALPKMAEASASDELREGFEEHLEQTRGHVQRLEQIFERLGEKPKGKKCKGMEGLVKEGSETLDEDMQEDTKDAGIIAAAQRVEHYEIAAYGTVRTYADLLGLDDDARLLEQTLEEEKETDQKLTQLAENINVQAEEGVEIESGSRAQSGARRSTTRRKPAA
jgi:ferritin-like metal-binding protein YciE